MERNPLKIFVIGSRTPEGKKLIPLICSGEVFGLDQQIDLRILNLYVKSMLEQLMEIIKEKYPLVIDVAPGYESDECFQNLDVEIFLSNIGGGTKTTDEELLSFNMKYFEKIGQIYCKMFIISCQTSKCLLSGIVEIYSSDLQKNFTSLSLNAQNLAISLLAEKTQIDRTKIRNVIL